MVIEAQAAGRPVVAADVGGISEGMIDGRTGGSCAAGRRAPGRSGPMCSATHHGRLVPKQRPGLVASRFGLERRISEMLEIHGLPAYASAEVKPSLTLRGCTPKMLAISGEFRGEAGRKRHGNSDRALAQAEASDRRRIEVNSKI